MAIDSGATAWILAATALVMIMTPGVGFFYGGLVRRKNLISMITLSFVAFALVSIQWVLIGYSLAFGNDPANSLNGFIGNLQYLGSKQCRHGARSLQHRDPRCAVHGIPAGLRNGDHGHRDIRYRRAGQVQRLPCVRAALDNHRLRSPGPLGMGRRLGGTVRCARLCRRDGRPHQFRVSLRWRSRW